MQGLRLKRGVTRITLLQQNAAGEVTPVVLFKKKNKAKKSTWGLGMVEKVIGRALDAQKEAACEMQRRHRSSKRSRRDGWLVEMGPNLFRAVADGGKKLRVDRLLDGNR